MGKVWIVEETGEVRQVKYGEFYMNDSGEYRLWDIKGESAGEYPILKVTEVIEDASYSSGWRVFNPITPKPEYHWVDDWF